MCKQMFDSAYLKKNILKNTWKVYKNTTKKNLKEP